MRNPESKYINQIDNSHSEKRESYDELGLLAEELVMDFLNQSNAGFEARLSTKEEDSGRQDIGPKQIIDAVVYLEGKPAAGVQITTANDSKIRMKKMQEISEHPFLRLPEMRNKDLAIPRVLVYIDTKKVNDYSRDKNFSNHPEIALQIIDGFVNSLKFDLIKTKNPLEIQAIKKLMDMLEQEKKRYLH